MKSGSRLLRAADLHITRFRNEAGDACLADVIGPEIKLVRRWIKARRGKEARGHGHGDLLARDLDPARQRRDDEGLQVDDFGLRLKRGIKLDNHNGIEPDIGAVLERPGPKASA